MARLQREHMRDVGHRALIVAGEIAHRRALVPGLRPVRLQSDDLVEQRLRDVEIAGAERGDRAGIRRSPVARPEFELQPVDGGRQAAVSSGVGRGGEPGEKVVELLLARLRRRTRFSGAGGPARPAAALRGHRRRGLIGDEARSGRRRRQRPRRSPAKASARKRPPIDQDEASARDLAPRPWRVKSRGATRARRKPSHSE